MENNWLQKLDEQVDRMPRPEFIEVSPNSRITFTLSETQPIALTISWQWVLARIGDALITRDAEEIIQLLFLEIDYVQLHKNALFDIYNIVRQPVDETALISTQAKIDSFKELMVEYLHQSPNNQTRLDYLLEESSLVLEQIKSLEIVGVGAFMIASCFHLALLQKHASSDRTKWSNVKYKAIEYSQYAARVSPKLFKLSVGRIDKKCSCTKWESELEVKERITEYECRYFDGKEIHLFRRLSPKAVTECNKHRLQMFKTVVDNVNKNAAIPVRSTIKKCLELAASI